MVDSGDAPITILMPTIPIREEMFRRAMVSISAQTVHPSGGIRIVMDRDHTGAAATRNRGLAYIQTPWVAFLDDDDELLPEHLEILWTARMENPGVAVIYTGCEVVTADGQLDHDLHLSEWGNFGRPFDELMLRRESCLPVTSLVRTDLAQQALFGPPPGSDYDDWGFYLRLLNLGARFLHIPERTWIWHHHDGNTSGQGDRWTEERENQ